MNALGSHSIASFFISVGDSSSSKYLALFSWPPAVCLESLAFSPYLGHMVDALAQSHASWPWLFTYLDVGLLSCCGQIMDDDILRNWWHTHTHTRGGGCRGRTTALLPSVSLFEYHSNKRTQKLSFTSRFSSVQYPGSHDGYLWNTPPQIAEETFFQVHIQHSAWCTTC